MAEVVIIRQIDIRRTRQNDRYAAIRVNLGASSDFREIDARIWALDNLLQSGASLPSVGDIIRVTRHKVEEYQGKTQWILQQFEILVGSTRESVRDPICSG